MYSLKLSNNKFPIKKKRTRGCVWINLPSLGWYLSIVQNAKLSLKLCKTLFLISAVDSSRALCRYAPSWLKKITCKLHLLQPSFLSVCLYIESPGFIIFLGIIWILQETTHVRILRYIILFIGKHLVKVHQLIQPSFLKNLPLTLSCSF